jgi:hypothetical protein
MNEEDVDIDLFAPEEDDDFEENGVSENGQINIISKVKTLKMIKIIS